MMRNWIYSVLVALLVVAAFVAGTIMATPQCA